MIIKTKYEVSFHTVFMVLSIVSMVLGFIVALTASPVYGVFALAVGATTLAALLL